MSNMFGRIHTLKRAKMEAVNYDFMGGSLPPGIQLTRASVGSYIDADGTLRYAAVDKPRFEWNYAKKKMQGILLEGASTNLIVNSVYTGVGAWNASTNVTITQNYGIAPDGSKTSAWIFSSDSGNSDRYANFNPSAPVASVVAGDVYTLSSFVRLNPASRSGVTFALVAQGSAFGSNYARFNIKTGQVTVTGTVEGRGIEFLKDGWVRVWVCLKATASVSNIALCLGYVYGDNSPQGAGAEVWGVQAEKSIDRPSSFIKTSGVVATRAGDVTTDPSVNWYDPTLGGTGLIELDMRWLSTVTTTPILYSINDGTTSNRTFINISNSGGTMSLRYLVIEGGVNLSSRNQTTTWLVSGQRLRAAQGYDGSGITTRANGQGAADGSGSTFLPSYKFNNLNLIVVGSQSMGCYLRLFRFYPWRRLDLTTVTQW